MQYKTKATELLRIQYPIIQGPFGGKFSSVKLLAAVSNLGGMGSFGLHAYGPEEIVEINREIRSQTDKTYALNLWVPLENDPVLNYTQQEFAELKQVFRPYFEELGVALPEQPNPLEQSFEQQVEALLRARPPVASFIFGVPESGIIRELKQRGIILIGTATTLEEARLIEDAGMDLVVASGQEAGGHRASFLQNAETSLTRTYDLVGQLVAGVKIPVIAAGGVSTGKDVAAMLRSGASAVQIGTAFLATEESNAPSEHKTRLLSDRPFSTELTSVFTGRLARAITNRLSESFRNAGPGNIAPYPIQSNFLSPLRQAAIEQNKTDLVAYWAGQASGPLTHKTAGDLFRSLVATMSFKGI